MLMIKDNSMMKKPFQTHFKIIKLGCSVKKSVPEIICSVTLLIDDLVKNF